MATVKLLISGILCLTFSGCLFESSQKKIEALVDGPIRDRLYSRDTKFNSIKVIFDSETKSTALDVTYEHIWVLHITAENTVIFTNERRRASLCVNIGTNKDVDTVRVFGVIECPEQISAKLMEDAKTEFSKIVAQINTFK